MEKFTEDSLLTDIDFKTVLTEKTRIWDPNPEIVQKAHNNICIMWNKNQQSRNFIKHLVAAFLPIDMMSRAFYVDPEKETKCVITGHKVCGIKNIAEGFAKFSTKKLFVDAKAIVENRDYTEEEKQELNSVRDKLPIEIRTGSVTFLSENSDKTISYDAVVALQHFVTNMILCDNKELMFTINKKRMKESQSEFSEEKRLNQKQINSVSKAATYGIKDSIDSDTFSKLEAMKKQLAN